MTTSRTELSASAIRMAELSVTNRVVSILNGRLLVLAMHRGATNDIRERQALELAFGIIEVVIADLKQSCQRQQEES